MTQSRGVVTVPALLLTVALGAVAGIGGYTFVYAKGGSYLTDDPWTCGNCHVMQAHHDGWRRGPHHSVATCNDCHTPAAPAAKYVVKALNGWHHSSSFTTGNYPDVIQLRASSRSVVEGQCRHCHADIVASIDDPELSCIRCHESVGHLR
jgi:cytochrome c nitrite reductase small subunit